MFFVPLVFFSILSEGLLQVLEKQNPPPLERETHVILLSFLCALNSFLSHQKQQKKKWEKTSVKPERETVASEDARESER